MRVRYEHEKRRCLSRTSRGTRAIESTIGVGIG